MLQCQAVLSDFRLRARQRAALAMLAQVVCPPGLESLDLREAVLAETELMIRALPAYLRTGLLAGLAAFDQGFRVFPGSGFRRFADAHDLAVADAYFGTWHESRSVLMFQFAKAIRGLVCFSYYEQPQVLEALGVRADDWIEQVRRRRLERYAEDVARADAEVMD